MAVHEDFYQLSSPVITNNAVTVKVQATTSRVSWWLTAVYGPQEDNAKIAFLEELRQIRSFTSELWLVIGDFNMILQAADKSNDNLNRRLMGVFSRAVNDLELKEIQLQERKYTWTNNITHTRIDRAFCTGDWEQMLPNCLLQASSSPVSDHSPLLLVGDTAVKAYRGFRFESFWPKIQGFKEQVADVWNKPVSLHNPFLRLHTKLQRTAKRFRSLSRSLIGNNKLLLLAAKQLIWILDVVQEFRQLSDEELLLKRDLKNRFLAMSTIEKLRGRQQSRITYIRAGDANSNFFFLGVNGRRRKKFIQSLATRHGVLHVQDEKEAAAVEHFTDLLGSIDGRDETLNWDRVNLNRQNLSHLEEPFTEKEVRDVIMEMHSEKAPGPDGYIRKFIKVS